MLLRMRTTYMLLFMEWMTTALVERYMKTWWGLSSHLRWCWYEPHTRTHIIGSFFAVKRDFCDGWGLNAQVLISIVVLLILQTRRCFSAIKLSKYWKVVLLTKIFVFADAGWVGCSHLLPLRDQTDGGEIHRDSGVHWEGAEIPLNEDT